MPDKPRQIVPAILNVPEKFELSPRECEVLSYLVVGAANKEIAQALQIEETTVKQHVKTILRKLRVDNRTQAAVQAAIQWVAKPDTQAETLPPTQQLTGLHELTEESHPPSPPAAASEPLFPELAELPYPEQIKNKQRPRLHEEIYRRVANGQDVRDVTGGAIGLSTVDAFQIAADVTKALGSEANKAFAKYYRLIESWREKLLLGLSQEQKDILFSRIENEGKSLTEALASMEAEGIDAELAQVVAREFDSSGPAALVGIRRAQRDARAIFARTQLPDDARDALKKGINSQLWEKAAQAFVLSAHRAHFSGRRDPLHVIALALDIPSKLAAELITNANETLMRDFNLVRDVAPGVYFALLERPKDQERELHSRGPGGSGE